MVGPWLAERDAADWVSSQMDDLPTRFDESPGLSAWLPTIGSRCSTCSGRS